ncbi:hypothetical protein [Thiolapillus sp.]|uniref:hypothetical protein n=1 Tax=Thiolapillus sp. TaxID=2017437 RepID=UPI003AF9CA65
MTRTAGARIGCQRLSRFWGLGCPKIYHEVEDTLGPVQWPWSHTLDHGSGVAVPYQAPRFRPGCYFLPRFSLRCGVSFPQNSLPKL